MKWTKLGLVYRVKGRHGFDLTHCHKPTPLLVDPSTLRVYFGTRDEFNRTRTTFIDVNPENPLEIKYIHDRPVIDLGKLGAFDDSGANVCSVVRDGKSILMYYIGANTSTTVHMRNAVGIAVSDDRGFTFRRLYDGAILDRTKNEPYYTGAAEVLHENGLWKCYYTSGNEWRIVDGKPEIDYQIKYATSSNGIDWRRDNLQVIEPIDEFEVCARPSVWCHNGIYHMYFSRRSITGFRQNPSNGYRAGYARSEDGIVWQRLDEEAGIFPSSDGWDSEGIAYPYHFDLPERELLFYNGNQFGRSGFGVAERTRHSNTR
ncbi:MAG TPA: hypothetical protein PK725_00255 [Rhodocyclaceae bacterium]|nr:hypothetical protein [Rhodocyclaceae bacterium]HRQ45343.1 hypothetical protein [Rhodocyclaceae bacterium]